MVKLNSVCRPRQWKTLSMEKLANEGFPVYGANGKIGFYSEYTHEYPTLAITCRGATCGSVHITEPKSYINGNAMALDNITNNIDIKFLYYYFIFRGFKDVISGSAQPQITGEGLTKIEIPLPPLATQQRIAAILDAADALRRKDQELLQKYDALAQAIFIDMFGDPVKNEKGWEVKNLGECILNIIAGSSYGGEDKELESDELGVLKVSAITSGKFKPEEYKAVKKTLISKSIVKVKQGDFLFSRANTRELVGATCLIDKDYNHLFLPDKIWKIDFKQEICNPKFMKSILSQKSIRYELNKTATGTSGSMLNISMQKLKDLSVIIPPIELQKQYGESYQKQNQAIANLKIASKESENLFQTLLQKSFKAASE